MSINDTDDETLCINFTTQEAGKRFHANDNKENRNKIFQKRGPITASYWNLKAYHEKHPTILNDRFWRGSQYQSLLYVTLT